MGNSVALLDLLPPPSSVVVNTQGPEVPDSNPEVPDSRLARVCGTLDGAVVLWPLTPWLINWLGKPRGFCKVVLYLKPKTLLESNWDST